MDKIQHHYHKSIFSLLGADNWWNPEISWNNKYRYLTLDSHPIEIWFHTYVLVTFSDAFHLFKSIRDNTLILCISLLFGSIYYFLLFKVVHMITFHLFYKYLWEK